MALTLPRNLLRAASASTGSQSLARTPSGSSVSQGSPAAAPWSGRCSCEPPEGAVAGGAHSAGPLLSPPRPRPLRSRRRKWEVPRAGRRSTPPPGSAAPSPLSARSGASLPSPPPLLPGGAAREVCAGRRAGWGGGTRGRGGGRGGGGEDGGGSPAWEWDGGTGD